MSNTKAELSASEISDLIEQRIANFDSSAESNISGKIVSVRDGIIKPWFIGCCFW